MTSRVLAGAPAIYSNERAVEKAGLGVGSQGKRTLLKAQDQSSAMPPELHTVIDCSVELLPARERGMESSVQELGKRN